MVALRSEVAPGVLPVVLLVDDDESLLVTTAALLEDDYEVMMARSAEEALSCLATRYVDVLCADLQMPGIDGLELLQRATRLYPDVACLLVTGHHAYLNDARVHGVNCGVILKPYEPAELLDGVRRAAQHTRIKRSLGRRPQGDEPVSSGLRKK